MESLITQSGGVTMASIPPRDTDILRRLAERQAAIAALPVHQEKAELWRRLNQLQPIRPLVWITELPWNEMNVNDELTLQTTDPWAQEIELGLRQLLYQWRHLPADMIVDDYLSCPLVVYSTGFGLSEESDIVRTDETSSVVSRHFHPQIVEPADVAKIKLPQVTCDAQATEENYQRMSDVFGDILPVRKVGKKHIWFAPWDELICWWGVQEAMLDLILRPQMVNEAMSRLVAAHLGELEQWEALDLLARNDDNTRIGSGGYGYTDDLPGEGFASQHVRPQDMWGCATAQIFSEVSPEMHWEFALRHELRWLERWGLSYYGCCDPLDGKMDIVRRIPNLRKVSMSPRVNLDRAVQAVGTDYVFSRKPNPAILAWDTWRPDIARQEIREFLEKARGCHVEIIMKDISTVRYQPQRLWEWEKIAMELAQEFAP
jgi:hypothetical protein